MDADADQEPQRQNDRVFEKRFHGLPRAAPLCLNQVSRDAVCVQTATIEKKRVL